MSESASQVSHVRPANRGGSKGHRFPLKRYDKTRRVCDDKRIGKIRKNFILSHHDKIITAKYNRLENT